MMSDPFDRAVARAESAAEARSLDRRRRRRRRIGRIQLRAFLIHATVFAVVQLLLFGIWLAVWLGGGGVFPWFVFPLVGWGIGLAAHYFAVRNSWRRPGMTPATDLRPTGSAPERPVA
jgi:hypothetical protein